MLSSLETDKLQINLGQRKSFSRINHLTMKLLKPLSHYRASTRVSTAYQDTKGTSRIRRTYVSIRSSYSSIRCSYFSYAEVLRFLMCALKNS